MKVRIGLSLGAASPDGDALAEQCRHMHELGFDSLWVADILSLPVDDPMVALAYAAGRVPRLKIGTTLVLPGRNVVRLARQVATLDRLSGGRFLLTVVPGLRRKAELQALGVEAGQREPQLDELLPLLRRLLTEDVVDHDGPAVTLHQARVGMRPIQDPFDMWTGGVLPAALERAAALADGWIPNLCPPEEAGAGRRRIEQRAAELGRSIDPEHFGVSIGYLPVGASPELAGRLASRRSGVAAADVVPLGLAALRSLIERYIEQGMSKFVVRPVLPDQPWAAELEDLAAAVLDLQS